MSVAQSERNHVIIGTAGHIDHGKTQLVKALTGIDADTLAEEKRRGITIELGFVFMETPVPDKQVVFIDVPGHEKLIKTMVAGASHIDAALLVIAADEGVNLQTREHFDILQLLGIEKGIIALTKADLVDEDRLKKLESEVKNFVEGTFLSDALIIPVSSVTGAGLEELKEALVEISQKIETREDSGVFRMPVDRVFTMRGFGTVIAGTILSGEVKVGDRIEIFPDGIVSKVRGIHVHHKQTESSGLGKRTAINLLGVDKERLRRGQCAGQPGSLLPTNRLDGRLHLLKNYGKELKNRARVRLHTGTAEIISRLVFLERDKLRPGEDALVQFVLETPTVALPQDRFVLRTFSPLMTIGGGSILDSFPPKHKRFDPQAEDGLKKLDGAIDEVVEQMFLKGVFVPQNAAEIALKIGKKDQAVTDAVGKLIKEGKLVEIASEKTIPEKDKKYLHRESYDDLVHKLLSLLKDFLEKNTHLISMPFSELQSAFLKITDSKTFNFTVADLIKREVIFRKGSKVSLVGYELKMKPQDQKMADAVENLFKEAGLKAPLEEEVCKDLNIGAVEFKKIMDSFIERDILVRLSDKVTYHKEAVNTAQEMVTTELREKNAITIADLRDKLRLSRKYAQAILEYFDTIGLTKREEDRHVIR
jgi:selenocysteine-specific elongation factor